MGTYIQDDIFEIIKENSKIKQWVLDAREYTEELKALISGKGYENQIIKIDHQESDTKQLARKKYTFSIKDVSDRLLRNLDNIYTANGGAEIYDIKNEDDKKELINWIGSLAGGDSLKEWNEENWQRS